MELFLTVYNYSIDSERGILKFLLCMLWVSFLYVACRSMRIVEKQCNRISRRIMQLKARMDEVLGQQGPVCHNILQHNIVRYRRSLVAGYLKDLINDKQFEPDKFSNFFKEFSEPSAKQNYESSTSSEESDSKSNVKNKFSLEDVLGELNSSWERNAVKCNERVREGKKNGMRIVKSPLDSKVFISIEGSNKRFRSGFYDKRKSKVPKWNWMGTKSAFDRNSESVTAFNTLTKHMSPFKAKTCAKNPPQKNTLTLKSSYAKQYQSLKSSAPFVFGETPKPKENESQDLNFENEKSMEDVTNVSEGRSMCSIGSSVCESEIESEPSEQGVESQIPFSSGNIRQNTGLTTINEESAEENPPSE